MNGGGSKAQLLRTFETRWGEKVGWKFLKNNISEEAYAAWKDDGTIERKEGSGRKRKITKEMEPLIKQWIEDDNLTQADVLKK